MVRACGALLSYLLEQNVDKSPRAESVAEMSVIRDRRTSEARLESGATFQVNSVTRLELDGRLHLESDVYEYLQIFHADPHPSALGGMPKEGISLFSLLNRCSSKAGTAQLEQWLLAPLSDPSLITSRLDCIDHLWSWIDEETDTKISFHLRKVHDLRLALSRLNSGTSTSKDWSKIRETCIAAMRMRELVLKEFSYNGAPAELLRRIMLLDDEPLVNVSKLINDTLDLNPTPDRKPQIRGGIDEEIDRLRGILRDLNGFLDSVAKVELSKYDGVSSVRVIYVPQIGFQLAIPIEEELPPSHPENPILQYATNQCAYYRTKTTIEMNELLGDATPQLADRSESVLQRVASVVLRHTRFFIELTSCMAELDVLIAMTRVSKENGYVRPNILNPIDAFALNHSNSGAIRIIEGRHPLLEHVMSKEAKRFVSNSTEIGLTSIGPNSDFYDLRERLASIHIVLGPNGSGKSVYLTQTGLIVFMAHLGCYVPATEADICVVDHLYTFASSSSTSNIGSAKNGNFSFGGLSGDSVHPSGSKSKEGMTSITSTGSGVGSFLNDAHKMGRILRNSTPLSLILVDEFGHGTAESDAKALLISSIEKLCSPRPLRAEDFEGKFIDAAGVPKVIISTHLKLLHSPTIVSLGNLIDFYHMNAVMVQDAKTKQNLPTYLYQLTPVTETYKPLQLGVYVAEMAGMDNWVLRRASQLKSSLFHNQPITAIVANREIDEMGGVDDRNNEEEEKIDRVLEELEKNFGTESLHYMDTLDAQTFISKFFDRENR